MHAICMDMIDLMYFYIKALVDFTDEEGYGKFLDLHHIYTKYCNLKQFQVCTIITVVTIR